jgi:hypothetical protein
VGAVVDVNPRTAASSPLFSSPADLAHRVHTGETIETYVLLLPPQVISTMTSLRVPHNQILLTKTAGILGWHRTGRPLTKE